MDASPLASAQGLYFALTGLWPLFHVRSFMAVTGPKRDLWLVKTVGCCVTAIGLALWVGRHDVTPALVVLAIASAGGLAAIDIVYVAKRVISPIYLADAAAEAALIAAWIGVAAAGK